MKFRWHGTEYAAEFVRRLESGAVIAKALGHGPRFAPGSDIEVQPNEIVSLDDEMQAGIFTGKPSDLQAAMDKERETLPTVAEVLADPNPTQPLSASSPAAAPQTGDTMTDLPFNRFTEKAKEVAGAATEVAAAINATFDDILARKQALLQRNSDLHTQHKQIIDQANAGLDVMESALRQISNGGPA